MPYDPNNQDMRKREGVFKAQKYRAIFLANDAESRGFIITVVEETWVIELEDLDTYYNKFTARHILNHLVDNCGGLDDTDAVDTPLAMPTWWDKNPSVPEYILRTKKGKRRLHETTAPLKAGNWPPSPPALSLPPSSSQPNTRLGKNSFSTSKRGWNEKKPSSQLTLQQIIPKRQTINVASPSAA